MTWDDSICLVRDGRGTPLLAYLWWVGSGRLWRQILRISRTYIQFSKRSSTLAGLSPKKDLTASFPQQRTVCPASCPLTCGLILNCFRKWERLITKPQIYPHVGEEQDVPWAFWPGAGKLTAREITKVYRDRASSQQSSVDFITIGEEMQSACHQEGTERVFYIDFL